LTAGAVILFAIASLVTVFIGVAGFGISELAREALRTGIAPGLSNITQAESPRQFSRAVTLCFILGNALFVTCAASAVAAGIMLYRSMP
jgi:hypothetical protein